MRIATFNANSIRARLEIVLDWLASEQPDVLAIQETKVEDDKFPIEPFVESGWHVAIHGQKSYNGVACISKEPMTDVAFGFGDPLWTDDCRILFGRYRGLPIFNTYVPNGTKVGSEKFDYKLRWLERFGQLVQQRVRPTEDALWLGDINIARFPDDVFDSAKMMGGVGHHPDEFAALDQILSFGWRDVFRQFHEGPGHYTYWEFVIPRSVERNLGWRIDHVYATPSLAEKCTSCTIDREPRMLERPSDHTFVIAEFKE